MSYHAFGEDPLPPDAGAPLCTDPNQWKEGSTCSQELCKTGFYWTGVDCVAVAKTGIPTTDPSELLQQVLEQECIDDGGEWDPNAGCIPGGTGTRVPDDAGGGGVTPAPPSAFDPSIVAANAAGAKIPGWVWAAGAALALVAVAVAVSPSEGR